MPEPRLPFGGDGEPPPAGRPADPMQMLGQAWMLYLSSALRAVSRAADAWARAMPAIEHALGVGNGAAELSPEARAALVDQLRALFRELAEQPAQESRRFLAELDRIAGASGAPVDQRHDDLHWRRWKAKP